MVTQSKKVCRCTSTTSYSNVQSDYGRYGLIESQYIKVKNWHKDEEMVVVLICLARKRFYSECMALIQTYC